MSKKEQLIKNIDNKINDLLHNIGGGATGADIEREREVNEWVIEGLELAKEIVNSIDLDSNPFKEYFMELYGDNLEVANWHKNGDLEPLDSFITSALEYEEQEESKHGE